MMQENFTRISAKNSGFDLDTDGISARVEAVAWEEISRDLDAEGNAIVKRILSPQECDEIRSLYQRDDAFRSRVVMERHGFGRGEYRYFSYPLPRPIATLRTLVFPHLVSTA